MTLLRQIEVGIANGKTTPQVCKEAEITVSEEYGGLKLDQAKRLKELEKEDPITPSVTPTKSVVDTRFAHDEASADFLADVNLEADEENTLFLSLAR